MNHREIIDLNMIANEVYCYLNVYMFRGMTPMKRRIKHKNSALNKRNSRTENELKNEFISALELVIKEMVLDTIRVCEHPYIRKCNDEDEPTELTKFCQLYALDSHELSLILDDLHSVSYTLDRISLLCGVNTFNIWTLERVHSVYILEDLGDMRITQWESEHIVNGKYVPD